jgi:DNA-binding PadR family transcriptional regulator
VTRKLDPGEFLPLPHLPLHILLALADGTRHGWAVIKRIEEMTGGDTRPSTGSLYLAMGRLAERRLIEEVESPDDDVDERRKYYRITPLGTRVLEAESRRLAALVRVARSADVLGSEPE